ncbi:hypothetical protein D3C78_623010 [compost metagenome]
MHVAASAERGSETHQPLTAAQQQRRSMVAGDIGRTQADIEDAHQLQRLGPERPRLDQLIMDEGRVVDQQIQVPAFAFNLGEQRLHLGIVAMIAGHRDALPAHGADGLGGGLQVTVQGVAIQT